MNEKMTILYTLNAYTNNFCWLQSKEEKDEEKKKVR